MKALVKLVVVPIWVGLGVVTALAPPASAATCVGRVVASDMSYTSAGSPAEGQLFVPGALVGGSFHMGAVAKTLKGVTYGAVATGSSNGYVNVDIWADNGTGTAPGRWIALIKRHTVVGQSSAATPIYLVSAVARTAPPILLSPSTTYWIVLSDSSDAPTGTPPVTWEGVRTSVLPATTNIGPGYSVGSTATGTWTSSAALGALTPFLEVRAC